LRDAEADGLYEFVPHHLIGLSNLLFICFEVSLDVLLQHFLVKRDKVLVSVQFLEDVFIFDAPERSYFGCPLVFKENLIGDAHFLLAGDARFLA
jgi:hypothetical protein